MNHPNIDLILWSEEQDSKERTEWSLGAIHRIQPGPEIAQEALKPLIADSKAEFILFWDESLGAPDAATVLSTVNETTDVWHAGLKLGTSGLPEEIDYVSSHWMLNRDPDPKIKAISWRISLRACLTRTHVLRELGQIDSAFETLDAVGLEMGYRYIQRGAVVIHEPKLLGESRLAIPVVISLHDRYLFIVRCFKAHWAKYVFVRRCFSSGRFLREISAYTAALKACERVKPPFNKDNFLNRPLTTQTREDVRTTVLIPTLCRYPYLRDTLQQLRGQSLRPYEVICIDQTPAEERQPDLYEEFRDLNLKLIWKDEPGQCSARNAGLEAASGNFILFLDDDILIEPDYVERMVEGLQTYDVDISVGVWSQGESEALCVADRNFRVSDRFSTGNSLAKSDMVRKVGGFDLHYNHNFRADADLGMRLYLAGATSIITPRAKECSLSAPTGGLRTFGAYDGMRKIGLIKPWPATTQLYYWRRFLSKRQVRECLILAFFASSVPRELEHSASFTKRGLFMLRQIRLLPFRLLGIWRSMRIAKQLVAVGPQISLIRNNVVNGNQ